jgi:FkbM family methyltransferase
MRIPFRIRFFARRAFSPAYWQKLSEVVASPFQFLCLLSRKLPPWSAKNPRSLKLKDGKVLVIREFWSLFLFDEIFIQRCYDAPEFLALGPFDVVIDIGANIGMFTTHSKQLWPKARIIAIEPHPENFAHLQEHVRINNLAEVSPFSVGVADAPGTFDLHLGGRNIGGHSMYKVTGSSSAISISVTTLSDILERAEIRGGRIAMKIDCEGCEYPVLRSLNQSVADRITAIIFEPELSLYSLPDLCRSMEGLGFLVSRFGALVLLTKPPRNGSHKR